MFYGMEALIGVSASSLPICTIFAIVYLSSITQFRNLKNYRSLASVMQEQKRKAYASRSHCTALIRPTSIKRLKVLLKISVAENANETVSSLTPSSTSNAIQCSNPPLVTRLKSFKKRVGEEVYLPEVGKGGIKRNRHGSHGARAHKKNLKRVVFKPVSPVVIPRQRKLAAPDSSLYCSSRLQRTSPRPASDKGTESCLSENLFVRHIKHDTMKEQSNQLSRTQVIGITSQIAEKATVERMCSHL